MQNTFRNYRAFHACSSFAHHKTRRTDITSIAIEAGERLAGDLLKFGFR
jgi:hypothetical protein